jgi:hypothetical protein
LVRFFPAGPEPGLGRPAAKRRAAPFFLGPTECAARLTFSAAHGAAKRLSMLSFIAKAAFGGLVIALVATIAKRYPGWGGLLAALPLTSILALSLLYVDTRETEPVAALATSILWFILPSLPLFIALPAMLRGGMTFWPALAICIVVTLALYAATFWALPRFGVKL